MLLNVFFSMGIGSVETRVAGGEASGICYTMQVSLAVALEESKPVTEGTRGLQWCIRTFTGNRE